jgi:hypothetical protein
MFDSPKTGFPRTWSLFWRSFHHLTILTVRPGMPMLAFVFLTQFKAFDAFGQCS